MGYIIKNITNKLDKRHPFVNSIVEFTYEKKNFVKDTVKLNVGKEMILDGELPISIHNLRIKGFILVKKISDNEIQASIKKNEEEIKNKNLAQIKETIQTSISKEDNKKSIDNQQIKKKRNNSSN